MMDAFGKEATKFIKSLKHMWLLEEIFIRCSLITVYRRKHM